MARGIFGFFGGHVRIAHPIRLDLIFAAVFSLRPIDQIHRPESRRDFSLLRVFFHHDVAVTDAFACRFNREGCAPAIAVFERVKRQRMIHIVRFVVCDFHCLQSETMGQI